MGIQIRDPIHGFIGFSDDEVRIINSYPFQRLRNIKQLALTSYVYPGAVHTRFEHSLGVTHLVSQAFDSALQNAGVEVLGKDEKKIAFYRQVLRLIALTHDIGHAPFSHASELLFPVGLEHEDYTRKIIQETEIADIISDIGSSFVKEYGAEYQITPNLISDIYEGKVFGPSNEYTLLKSFMDSELDCDKMDYLLRDSYYCGVKYGTFDKDRLVESFTIYPSEDGSRLAIKNGGVQAVEEFILARYFMFIQVYFHKTRRFFDKMLVNALKCALPKGHYPANVSDFLLWDDVTAISKMRKHLNNEFCRSILERNVYSSVYETKPHPQEADKRDFNFIVSTLKHQLGDETVFTDTDADKSPHKIPRKSEINDEKAILVYNKATGEVRTISEGSEIIKGLMEKIDIRRVYCKKDKVDGAKDIIRKYVKMQEEA